MSDADFLRRDWKRMHDQLTDKDARLSAALDLLEAVEPYLRRAVAVEAAARGVAAFMRNTVVEDDLRAALSDLPTNPLEMVRALLHSSGRSLEVGR